MTSKERVHCLFEGGMPDKIPIYISGVSSRVASFILGREAHVGGGVQQYREARALWEGPGAHAEFLKKSDRDAQDIAEVFDCDLVRPSYWRMNRKPNRKIDDVTFVFRENNRDIVRRYDPEHELFPVIQGHEECSFELLQSYVEYMEKDAANYRVNPEDFASLLSAADRFHENRAVYGEGVGIGLPHEGVWLEAMATSPDLVERLLDAQVEIATRRLDAYAGLKIDVRLMFGGGDMASQQGPLFSPAMFRQFLLPRYRKVGKKARALGKYYLFASDGNLWPVADDLFVNSGIDGYYEVDKMAGMELPLLREKYPDLVLLGGVASRTLHLGAKDDIKKEADAALATAKKYGRIIVGPSNQVISHTPPENLIFLMDYLKRNR